MNKKKLPKVLRQPDANFGEVVAGVARWPEPVARRAQAGEAAGARPPAPQAMANVIEMALKPEASPPPDAERASLTPATSFDAGAARRRPLGRAIVERHANLSALGGFILLPLVNVAGITAIIVRMVKLLCRLYGLPFERNRVRAIIIGMVGSTMPAGLSTVATSTMAFIVPGSGLFSLAVSSVAASACTRSIGYTIIEHFEQGATLKDFPVISMR
ncbi:MAG: DUF697 domain-containing protein [Proteobacteria bacterium]|nr:DUF697 domain-containing protein [Pseudomonadota bacterium]